MTGENPFWRISGWTLIQRSLKRLWLHQIGDYKWDHRRRKNQTLFHQIEEEERSLPSSTASWSSTMLQTEGENTSRRPKKLLWAPEKLLTAALQLPRWDCEPPAESPRPLVPAETTPELLLLLLLPPQDHTSGPTFKIRFKEKSRFWSRARSLDDGKKHLNN